MFEQVAGLLVVSNAIALGSETNYCATHTKEEIEDNNALIGAAETSFCVLFTIELGLRLFVHRAQFFVMDGWPWNVFDTVVVGLQVIEQLALLTWLAAGTGLLRFVRILRLLRITRLVRILHLFRELRTIVNSIVKSSAALLWTLLLLFMTIYSFSVVFCQLVLEYGNLSHSDNLEYWFRSVPRTMLTLFECLVGGVSWDEVVILLINDISPVIGVLLCVFVAIGLFIILNVVTGVFVDKAMRVAQEEGDIHMANTISSLFLEEGAGRSDDRDNITWKDFQRKVHTPAMEAYFKSINVNVSEARGVFELLDADDSGTVDAEEIVKGCLRLRGVAKALDVLLLMQETFRLSQFVDNHLTTVSHRLSIICSKLGIE